MRVREELVIEPAQSWACLQQVKNSDGSSMILEEQRQHRTLSLHDVFNGRQYNNNETIAFFGDTWDIFASR